MSAMRLVVWLPPRTATWLLTIAAPDRPITRRTAAAWRTTSSPATHARLDGRFPITLRTADQVKQILRFCDPAQEIATRYAQYMS
jgi:hypothetical protein